MPLTMQYTNFHVQSLTVRRQSVDVLLINWPSEHINTKIFINIIYFSSALATTSRAPSHFPFIPSPNSHVTHKKSSSSPSLRQTLLLLRSTYPWVYHSRWSHPPLRLFLHSDQDPQTVQIFVEALTFRQPRSCCRPSLKYFVHN